MPFVLSNGGGSGASTDGSGIEVIGTALVPVTLAVNPNFTTQSTPTDVAAYRQCSWYVIVASKDGATTQIDVQIDWTADGGTVFSPQGTESISAGASTLSIYQAQYDVSGFPPLSGFSLPVIALPVVAPEVRIRVRADAGSTTAYVLVARQV